MRWWALFGTAVTLSISLCVVVGYYELPRLATPDANGVRRTTAQVARSTPAPIRPPATPPSRSPGAASPTTGSRRRPWIARFNIDYALGVDGISLPLVVLTALVTFLAIIASWKIEKSVRGYLDPVPPPRNRRDRRVPGARLLPLLRLLRSDAAADVLPHRRLGRRPRGSTRRIKFVLYTLLGSVGILVAMIGLYTVDVRDFVDQERGAGSGPRTLAQSQPVLTAPKRGIGASRSTRSTSSRSRRPGRAVDAHPERPGRPPRRAGRAARTSRDPADDGRQGRSCSRRASKPRGGHRAAESAAVLHQSSSSTSSSCCCSSASRSRCRSSRCTRGCRTRTSRRRRRSA